MNGMDWGVLLGTQALILVYGLWSMGHQSGSENYLRARTQSGWMVGLSIMATQASAITFLSAPGLAYTQGLGFVQFYLGLPLAMILISAFILPKYYRLNVYTAYEFLESRFDGRVRRLAAFLFLTQRGLAAGLTIYAPALILSTVLNWNLIWTNLLTGLVVLAYTLSGGSKAVARTQVLQMGIILMGMGLAAWWMIRGLPEPWSIKDAWDLAAIGGRTEALVWRWNWEDKYSLWTGLLGGGFLMLSYFGTDQSQVQRYLGGQSLEESRRGLALNAVFKLPMQLLILMIGVLMFAFYVIELPPVNFKYPELESVEHRSEALQRRTLAMAWQSSPEGTLKDSLARALSVSNHRLDSIRLASQALRAKASPQEDFNDTNFIFIRYVLNHLPVGLVGLLISMVFCASMSSTSAELSALSTTTLVDFYARNAATKDFIESPKAMGMGRWFTLAWGFYAIGFAMVAQHLGTLIEAVNVLGSLVYGTILGIFLSAFFTQRVGSKAVLLAALVTELLVLFLFWGLEVPYLWLNMVGALAVPILSLVWEFWTLQVSSRTSSKTQSIQK
ncbi:MAG: sodium:solute symporter [Sphingobacteriia bacterium]|nr:sodium:solute symporter [Sphingobacteriia bacterium]